MMLDEFAATYLPQVGASLVDLLQQSDASLGALYGMMQYHHGWVDAELRPVETNPGKRLRPLLCLLCCQAAGGEPTQALPAASALELVHSFSLVHDDIEDGSRMRRGRPAVWDVWGQAQAINVGDALFALAHLSVLGLASGGVSIDRTLSAAQALDRACLALCEGQFLDMSFERRTDVDLPQYLRMIRLKTAALLAASAQIGAIVAVEDRAVIAQMHSFGEHLGLAFQIQDDLLGIWGEEDITGKSALTDLRDKKKTLPVIHAMVRDEHPADARRLSSLFGQAGPLGEQECSEALAILERAGSKAYAEAMAAHYLQLALDCLSQIALREPDVQVLSGLARSLLSRRA